MLLNNDTICALATAPGGAIGVIRLSGTSAIHVANSVFSKDIENAKPNSIHYGCIIDPSSSEVIDDVLISLFRAPHSYTGEDSIEISCHGSRFILAEVLQLLIRQGARQAMAGEFTRRAYQNGKMDLSQAEAVADLISSTNSATHKLAMSQLKGNFSSELASLRDQLLQITSLLELELDFSEEDVDFADRQKLLHLATYIHQHITKLADSFRTGQAIKQGISVAIVGHTNVGKSSLLNTLVGEDRAIVSDIHGTTRDTIEEILNINGVAFRLIDTAGLRSTTDEIEQIGINRTKQKIDESSIIMWICDTMPSSAEIESMEMQSQGKTLLKVLNKCDLHPIPSTTDFICISAKQSTGIDNLKEALFTASNIPAFSQNDVIVTSARHYDALIKANSDILRVIEGLNINLSGDLISEDLRQCIDHLSDIVGGTIQTDEVLGSIFSSFCIGK